MREPISIKKVLIIIPAFNEQESILKTYSSIVNYSKSNDITLDVIVINDCSKDNTANILDEQKIPHVDLVHNLGIGGAVQTGYKFAKDNNYDIAIQFDGDGQHNAEYIMDLIKPLIEGEADFSIGSRFIDSTVSDFKSSKARQIGIKIISFFIKVVAKKSILDTTSGFRAANKKIIQLFSLSYPTEYPEPITTATLLKQGFRVKEVAVSMNERDSGKSSIHSWKNIYYMINVIVNILIVGIRRK